MHDMKVEDLLGENTGEFGDSNLLTVAAMGNSGFLEDLLRAGMDPDVGDAKDRTALVGNQSRKKKRIEVIEFLLRVSYVLILRTPLLLPMPLAAHRGVQGVRGLRAGAAQARVQREHQR